MKITREDVLRVAELAHLELTPEEVELYRGQLDEILNYIGKLEQLDVSNVEPMAQVLFTGVGSPAAPVGKANEHPELRDDTLQPCDVAEAILAQAPDSAKPFFRVPKVIDR
jgi:aspartyl-tRNA(Asn)/glutamyl-tRNA(Gln) amidotransferase subunit C